MWDCNSKTNIQFITLFIISREFIGFCVFWSRPFEDSSDWWARSGCWWSQRFSDSFVLLTWPLFIFRSRNYCPCGRRTCPRCRIAFSSHARCCWCTTLSQKTIWSTALDLCLASRWSVWFSSTTFQCVCDRLDSRHYVGAFWGWRAYCGCCQTHFKNVWYHYSSFWSPFC